MKTSLIFLFLLGFLVLSSCASRQQCQDGLNLLPMYGGQQKCSEQLKIDQDFLVDTDKQFRDRREAARYYVDKAWTYYNKNDGERAMKRFNQAWLLDSTNADIYWGFGNILGMKQQFWESIPLLEKSISINPSNAKVHQSIATSYGQLFFLTKEVKLLKLAISHLKRSIQLDASDVTGYAQITAAYSYFLQKDSARKYLKLADRLDKSAVNPEVRKILSEN